MYVCIVSAYFLFSAKMRQKSKDSATIYGQSKDKCPHYFWPVVLLGLVFFSFSPLQRLLVWCYHTPSFSWVSLAPSGQPYTKFPSGLEFIVAKDASTRGLRLSPTSSTSAQYAEPELSEHWCDLISPRVGWHGLKSTSQ